MVGINNRVKLAKIQVVMLLSTPGLTPRLFFISWWKHYFYTFYNSVAKSTVNADLFWGHILLWLRGITNEF